MEHPSREQRKEGGKSNGGYEKKAEEEIAKKRTNRGTGRWLGLPLAPLALDVGANEEVVDVKIGVEVEAGIVDVESLEMDVRVDGVAAVADASKGLDRERDVASVPTVMVRVPDEVDESVSDSGMGIDDIAAGSGELNDPDIPVRLKNGENAV